MGLKKTIQIDENKIFEIKGAIKKYFSIEWCINYNVLQGYLL